MPIPVGVTVEILPFTAQGCVNNVGTVMKCCTEWACLDGTTGQRVAVSCYTVRYMVSNCNECAVYETCFCEEELLELPIPPNKTKAVTSADRLRSS